MSVFAPPKTSSYFPRSTNLSRVFAPAPGSALSARPMSVFAPPKTSSYFPRSTNLSRVFAPAPGLKRDSAHVHFDSPGDDAVHLIHLLGEGGYIPGRFPGRA
jgi:hypothetical protein